MGHRITGDYYIDSKATHGTLLFLGLEKEVMETDANGEVTAELKKRRYALFSERQKEIILVSLPKEVGEKMFARKEPVELVNCRLAVIGNRMGDSYATIQVYAEADDIVKAGQAVQSGQSGQTGKPGMTGAGQNKPGAGHENK